ncbi:MAG: DUF5320 domain-containing protein [Sedimentisphaerales bacterium]|nr:DUF5320 domain-containing protein [Sedimentisphaerales bacterium]MBN2842176.1 DUF5320 domain-containing protein [Sedimentisphaerales bacterium]
MPNLNGTGPQGKGPKTGRGMGCCNSDPEQVQPEANSTDPSGQPEPQTESNINQTAPNGICDGSRKRGKGLSSLINNNSQFNTGFGNKGGSAGGFGNGFGGGKGKGKGFGQAHGKGPGRRQGNR